MLRPAFRGPMGLWVWVLLLRCSYEFVEAIMLHVRKILLHSGKAGRFAEAKLRIFGSRFSDRFSDIQASYGRSFPDVWCFGVDDERS